MAMMAGNDLIAKFSTNRYYEGSCHTVSHMLNLTIWMDTASSYTVNFSKIP